MFKILSGIENQIPLEAKASGALEDGLIVKVLSSTGTYNLVGLNASYSASSTQVTCEEFGFFVGYLSPNNNTADTDTIATGEKVKLFRMKGMLIRTDLVASDILTAVRGSKLGFNSTTGQWVLIANGHGTTHDIYRGTLVDVVGSSAIIQCV